MSDILRESWSSFSEEIANSYLKTFGHPSTSSKELLTTILTTLSDAKPKIIDLGCGNGQLFGYFKEHEFNCEYLGVDFSKPLLAVAEKEYQTFAEASFLYADLNELDISDQHFDFAIYSHVLEILSSPERSLNTVKNLASTIVVRFFEPPEFDFDTAEVKQMNIGQGDVYYLRRKMSKDYYRMILSKINAREVDVYKDPNSKDQIHIIRF